MGMYLTAHCSLHVRTWNRICEAQKLPVPKVDEAAYCAVIDQELYNVYRDRAEEIFTNTQVSNMMRVDDFMYMKHWSIIVNAVLNKRAKNDSDNWEDLYFS